MQLSSKKQRSYFIKEERGHSTNMQANIRINGSLETFTAKSLLKLLKKHMLGKGNCFTKPCCRISSTTSRAANRLVPLWYSALVLVKCWPKYFAWQIKSSSIFSVLGARRAELRSREHKPVAVQVAAWQGTWKWGRGRCEQAWEISQPPLWWGL